MKKTYLMLLLALAGLGSSCTNEAGTAGRANSCSAEAARALSTPRQ